MLDIDYLHNLHLKKLNGTFRPNRQIGLTTLELVDVLGNVDLLTHDSNATRNFAITVRDNSEVKLKKRMLCDIAIDMGFSVRVLADRDVILDEKIIIRFGTITYPVMASPHRLFTVS